MKLSAFVFGVASEDVSEKLERTVGTRVWDSVGKSLQGVSGREEAWVGSLIRRSVPFSIQWLCPFRSSMQSEPLKITVREQYCDPDISLIVSTSALEPNDVGLTGMKFHNATDASELSGQ